MLFESTARDLLDVPTYHIRLPSPKNVSTAAASHPNGLPYASSSLSNRTRLSPTRLSVDSSTTGAGATAHTSFYTHSSSSLSSLHSMTLSESSGTVESDSEEGGRARSRVGASRASGPGGFTSSSSRANSVDLGHLFLEPDEPDIDPCAPVAIGITTPPGPSVSGAAQRPSVIGSGSGSTHEHSRRHVRSSSSADVARAAGLEEVSEFKPPATKAYSSFRTDPSPSPQKPPEPRGWSRVRNALHSRWSMCYLAPLAAAVAYLSILMLAFYLPRALEEDAALHGSGLSPFGSLSLHLSPAPIYSPFLMPTQQNQLRVDLKNARCSAWMERVWPDHSWRSSVLVHGAEPTAVFGHFGRTRGLASGQVRPSADETPPPTSSGSPIVFADAAQLPPAQQMQHPTLDPSLHDAVPFNSHPPPASSAELHPDPYASAHQSHQPHHAMTEAEYQLLAQQQYDFMAQQQHHHQQLAAMQHHHQQQYPQQIDPTYLHDPAVQHQQQQQQMTHQHAAYHQQGVHGPMTHEEQLRQHHLQMQQQHQQPQPPPQQHVPSYASPPSVDLHPSQYDSPSHTPSILLQQAAEYQRFLAHHQLADQIARHNDVYAASRPVQASVGEVGAKMRERLSRELEKEKEPTTDASDTTEAARHETDAEAPAAAVEEEAPSHAAPSEPTTDSTEKEPVKDEPHASAPTPPPPPPDDASLTLLLKQRREKERESASAAASPPAPQPTPSQAATVPPAPSASMHSPPSHFSAFRPLPLAFYFGCSTALLLLPWIGAAIAVANLLISIALLTCQWWDERQAVHAARSPSSCGDSASSHGVLSSLLSRCCGRLARRQPNRGTTATTTTRTRRIGGAPSLGDPWCRIWGWRLTYCCIGGFPSYLLRRRREEAEKRGKKGL